MLILYYIIVDLVNKMLRCFKTTEFKQKIFERVDCTPYLNNGNFTDQLNWNHSPKSLSNPLFLKVTSEFQK